jgi:hypothetical protein
MCVHRIILHKLINTLDIQELSNPSSKSKLNIIMLLKKDPIN